MAKIRLDSLIFSIADYLAIRDWFKSNSGIFDVTAPSGIVCAPLAKQTRTNSKPENMRTTLSVSKI